jgi:hypothetical protein
MPHMPQPTPKRAAPITSRPLIPSRHCGPGMGTDHLLLNAGRVSERRTYLPSVVCHIMSCGRIPPTTIKARLGSHEPLLIAAGVKFINPNIFEGLNIPLRVNPSAKWNATAKGSSGIN